MNKLDKEVAHWRETIANLTGQREKAAKRVDGLREKKRPLALGAHTGDETARGKLEALNAELLAAMQDLEDVDEAVRQAEAKLADSETAVAVAREAQRLRKLSALADQRVDVAAKIEGQLQELADALAHYHNLGIEMQRHVPSSDETISRKLDGSARLDIVFGRILGEFVPVARMGRNPIDPRKDTSLPDMERDALCRFLINPGAAEKMAKMKAARAA